MQQNVLKEEETRTEQRRPHNHERVSLCATSAKTRFLRAITRRCLVVLPETSVVQHQSSGPASSGVGPTHVLLLESDA